MIFAQVNPARSFETGSPSHLGWLLFCAVALVVFGWKGKAAKRNGDLAVLRRLKHFAGYGCLVVWVVNTVFWYLPSRFAWSSSLPLQFCNLANLIGAAAVLGGGRFWKTILYFWMPVLCIWAFLTPVLHGGYATFEFWIFWIYHLFIPLALTEVLVVQDYRPTFADLKKAWMFTVGYMALLAVPDYLFEWNYGFVGPSKPDSPTLIDVLGPYPWRLFWMIAIGTVLYLLVWLPGRRRSIEPC